MENIKFSVTEWFEEGHCFVYRSVFVPVVEDVLCILEDPGVDGRIILK